MGKHAHTFHKHYAVVCCCDLQAVPPCLVGTSAKLQAVVKLLCEEMTSAFKSQGLPVPPWRTRQAMLSKWAPNQLAALAAKIADMRSCSAVLPPLSSAVVCNCHPGLCNGDRPAAHASHAAVGSAPAYAHEVSSAGVLVQQWLQPTASTAYADICRQGAATAMAAAADGAATQFQGVMACADVDMTAMVTDIQAASTPDGKLQQTLSIAAANGHQAVSVQVTSDARGGNAISAFAASAAAAAQAFLSSPQVQSAYGSSIKFTRKASAEWKQQANGKKMKSLLAAALKKSSSKLDTGRDDRARHIRVTGDEPWSRITTVRWGAYANGAADNTAVATAAVAVGAPNGATGSRVRGANNAR